MDPKRSARGGTERTSDAARRRKRSHGLKVTGVVQHGTGRGSRIDLTIVAVGQIVPLTGVPAMQVLSYGRIRQLAIERGVVLPLFRDADRVWTEVLSQAMKDARMEPSLEGERVSEVIAAEIRGGPASAARWNPVRRRCGRALTRGEEG